LVGRLPPENRELARRLGIGFALLTRLGLLFSLSWVIGLTDPWFTILGEVISGRDVVLLLGGLFLLFKSTKEIHGAMEGREGGMVPAVPASLLSTIVQFGILDMVLSLGSVIAAVGLVDELEILVIAILVAVAVMLFSARTLRELIDYHPTLKMLALP